LKPSTPELGAPSTSGREDGNGEADYTIQLITSNEDRASLSIANAGIMLSLIGEGGEALVQRILPVEEKTTNDVLLRFQRGAVDVVHFRGPNIGRISALWIAPEAGLPFHLLILIPLGLSLFGLASLYCRGPRGGKHV